MYPILIRISGPYNIYTYGVFLALGFVTAITLVWWQVRRWGLPAETARWLSVPDPNGRVRLEFADVINLALFIFVGGVVGSRLLFIFINNPLQYIKAPWRFVYFWEGGLVFYGGVIAGIAMALWFAHRRKVGFMGLADVLAPAVSAGHALGRVGCLMAGCCYGRACHLPWAITFTHPQTLAPKNIPLHPTQIYSAVGEAIICTCLLLWQRKKRFDGQIVLIYLTVYPILRFIVETFRADIQRGFVQMGSVSLSTSQTISLILFVVAVMVWIWISLKRRKTSAAHPE